MEERKMNGMVVYDSVYGNTKTVAEVIAKTLASEGHTAEVVHVREAPERIPEAAFLFVGSPTRVGTMTRKTRKLLKAISEEAIRGKPLAAFDTEGEAVIKANGASAAAKIHDLAKSKGAKVHTPVLKVGVSGIKGPLSPNAEEIIRSYVREFVSTLAP
jgi:flavorubredoxin